MDFKSLFDEAKTELLTSEHPLANTDSSIKHAYLTGLAIIAATNAKDEFTKVEKQYLEKMAISLNLPDELYKNALNTGKNPDKSVIKTIVETIDQRYMQFLFLIDAWQLSKIDGTVSETENHIIESYIQFFKFTIDNCQLLENLMSAIEKNDIENFKLSINEVIGIEKNTIKDVLKYYFSDEENMKEEWFVLHEQQKKIEKEINDIQKRVKIAIDMVKKKGIEGYIDDLKFEDVPYPKEEIKRLKAEYEKLQIKINSIVKAINKLLNFRRSAKV
ncbi:MAG: hypothetical protein QMC67_10270 [Candidatus Wallbacteria bacterium]